MWAESCMPPRSAPSAESGTLAVLNAALRRAPRPLPRPGSEPEHARPSWSIDETESDVSCDSSEGDTGISDVSGHLSVDSDDFELLKELDGTIVKSKCLRTVFGRDKEEVPSLRADGNAPERFWPIKGQLYGTLASASNSVPPVLDEEPLAARDVPGPGEWLAVQSVAAFAFSRFRPSRGLTAPSCDA